jgi:plastocyanin
MFKTIGNKPRVFRSVGLVALSGLLAFSLLACGDDDDDGNGNGDTNGGATQEPTPSNGDGNGASEEVTVAVADNVTWEWSGEFPHSVVGEFAGETVESDQMTGTGTFSYTFEEAGTFEYQCGVHGEAMSGTVTVEG